MSTPADRQDTSQWDFVRKKLLTVLIRRTDLGARDGAPGKTEGEAASRMDPSENNPHEQPAPSIKNSHPAVPQVEPDAGCPSRAWSAPLYDYVHS